MSIRLCDTLKFCYDPQMPSNIEVVGVFIGRTSGATIISKNILVQGFTSKRKIENAIIDAKYYKVVKPFFTEAFLQDPKIPAHK